MSEYQYYEFQAIDKPLSEKEQEELRDLSTRAKISSSVFTNEYHFGNFKGDPKKMVEKYFDAFMYYANWGTRWLILRIPKKLIDPELAEQYCDGDSAVVYEKGPYLIFEFVSEADDYEWEDIDFHMASLASLRADLIRGDYRCLYLAWLYSAMMSEVREDDKEPPVPPNLGNLNSSLKSFADFMRIDTDLIDAAAENSIKEQYPVKDQKKLKTWVSDLSPAEKDKILIRLISNNDVHLGNELLQRFKKQLSKNDSENKVMPLRTAAELIQKGDRNAEERQRRLDEQRLKEKARREKEQAIERENYLNDLAGRENEIWEKINELIQIKQPRAYDQAILHISDLEDLAGRNKAVGTFKKKLISLMEIHSRKPSLLRRLESAGLKYI